MTERRPRPVHVEPIASILWRRLDLRGHDACQLRLRGRGRELDGTAVFVRGKTPVRLHYSVRCDIEWNFRTATVEGWIGLRKVAHSIARRGRSWVVDGNVVHLDTECVDLDFGFTPATNLIQLRRVTLNGNEPEPVHVPVAWLDVSGTALGALTVLHQTYELVGIHRYAYSAPSAKYHGVLEVDSHGFVTRYPGLWVAETRSK